MDLLDSQPEFTKSFWDYLDLLVTDDRIAQGPGDHRQVSQGLRRRSRRDYGVDRYLITAIWGVETNYGTNVGDRPVLRSTATLACIGRRQRYFRDEFLAALEIVSRGDIRADRSGRLLGRRFRPDAVHADRVQALCRRFRPRRPP